jgi:FixJ family two-component response regulator
MRENGKEVWIGGLFSAFSAFSALRPLDLVSQGMKKNMLIRATRHFKPDSIAPQNTQIVRLNLLPVTLITEDESMQADAIAALRLLGMHLQVFLSPWHFEQRLETVAGKILLIDQERSLSHNDPFIARCLQQPVSPRLILLAEQPQTRSIVAAMRAGVAAVLEKPVSAEALQNAVRMEMERPEIQHDPSIRTEYPDLLTVLQSLTDRQRRVTELIYEGNSNRQIADALSIAVKTVESHRAQIMARLKLTSVAALIRLLDQIKRS